MQSLSQQNLITHSKTPFNSAVSYFCQRRIIKIYLMSTNKVSFTPFMAYLCILASTFTPFLDENDMKLYKSEIPFTGFYVHCINWIHLPLSSISDLSRALFDGSFQIHSFTRNIVITTITADVDVFFQEPDQLFQKTFH